MGWIISKAQDHHQALEQQQPSASNNLAIKEDRDDLNTCLISRILCAGNVLELR